MPIVIDIPEKIYTYIQRGGIKNDAPLPKGCGRLINISKKRWKARWRNIAEIDPYEEYRRNDDMLVFELTVDGNPIENYDWETMADVLRVIDKYKEESEEKE